MALTTTASSAEVKERIELGLHVLFWGELYSLFHFATYTVGVLALGVRDVPNACEFVSCLEDGNEHLGLTKGKTFPAVRFGYTYLRLKELLVPYLCLFR